MRPMCYPRAVLSVTDGLLLLRLCPQMEDLCEVSSGQLHVDYTRWKSSVGLCSSEDVTGAEPCGQDSLTKASCEKCTLE